MGTLSLLLAVLGCFTIALGEFVTVETVNGPLRGEKRDFYYAFEGIPYAKAPLGELRLAPSVVNDARWEEPRDATEPGPVCLQWSHFVEGEDRSTGEEDCLFMNVYTTSVGVLEEPLPTIFFIHGGAFMFGSGDFYKPDNLLRKPMVLVTFNYRLGPLGFLSTEDDVIPGNYGLKDQVTALRWVRSNIEVFGGHADNITIVGYSAGSASVQLHYLSPMSRGLFKNGIGHSGSALNPWVLAEDSAKKAQLIANAVGCPTTSSTKMLQCLREKPALDIVRAVGPLFRYLYNPFSPLGVVIEKQSKNNPRPFLADHPYKLMKSGKYFHVPLILSVNEAEGLYPGGEFISREEYLLEIDERWNQLVPHILDYHTSLGGDDADNEEEEVRRNEISQMIRKRYLGRRMLSDNSFRDFIRMISNRLYFTGVVTSAKLMQVHSPIYLYYDVYKTKYGVGELLAKSMKNYGVAHGEDVLLVFKSVLRDEIPYTEEELLVAGKFVAMYDTFARESVARFGDADIPRMDRADLVRFLEIKHPKSEPKLARQLNDEGFWSQLDFGDGMPVEKAPSKKEEL
ncbi:venom carboxylesterase-6-like [Culex pipiens pallens]|uniref:venom carboxylesterase-6-like n=1 Tax=Culex pipiens pallens TaxID=42434 RepID=UPI0019533662|nr:venom carboxylesterase-6-like [Culex pipiens pallens]